MKNLTEEVHDFLKADPRFRERKKKNRGIGWLLSKQYSFLKNIDLGILASMIEDAGAMYRYWRKILHEHPELRGSDYNDKAALEEIKQMELGYGQQPLIEK
jgi:hypothetical protein